MTATEELRRMLTERGVEWADIDTGSKRSHITLWHDADGMEWQYYEDTRTGWTLLRCSRDYLTPEQAVEATLGRGTCKLERTCWDDGTCTWGCICSACNAHLEHETGIGYNYCPICGAEVVDA